MNGRVDVVVAGGGSAGAVLAGRLSEDPWRRVLLLEAGADEATPRAPSFAAAIATPGRVWEDLHARRVAGAEATPYLRGRGLGGTSAINAMIAIAGEPDDYDEWERAYGCAGWGWRDVEPWFARTDLALTPAPRREWGAISTAFAAAAPDAAAGVDLTRDADGHRVSVADAYVTPARGRPNFAVRGHSLVDRLLLDGRRVRGVRLADGEEIESGLVILSAGAIHSPAILLRSGVDTAGVGENLHDHPSFPIPLARTQPADVESIAIVTAAVRSSADDLRDLQLLPMEYVDPSDPLSGLLLCAVMRVWSRGSLRLASDDPHVHPAVDLGMLGDERDWVALSAAIDAGEQLLATPVLRNVCSPRPYERTLDAARAALGHYLHAAGTCAMGTVVDARCRVRGYDGLVVCDASVMPNLPRANPHLPIVMIAERVASMLRSDTKSA